MPGSAAQTPAERAAAIDSELAGRVMDRLGLAGGVTLDANGLGQLYRRWCRTVPFDNVRKLISLRSGPDVALPGRDATDFFEAWLAHGVGGTCWPGAVALSALCRSLGFDARLVSASMADTGIPSHGTTVVTIENVERLVDTSMLTDRPLQLSSDHETEVDHPVFGTTATPVPEGWLFGFPIPYGEGSMPCRTVDVGGVGWDHCMERYELSREMSPVNSQVSTRRNDEAGVVSYGGGRRFRRTDTGIVEEELVGADLRDALVDEFAMSVAIVDRLGALGVFEV